VRNLKFIVIAIVVGLFLSACSSLSNPDDGWQIFTDDELGISFEVPDTWVSEVEGDVITVAVDQEALDNGIINGAGASITLATARDFDGFSEPGGILELFMDYFEYGRTDLERIGDPELITVQEQPAGTISYRGTVRDRSGYFTATVISNDENIALVLTIDGSENEEHLATLDRITQSISVYETSE
jgi:hypothetical protein